MVVAILDVCHLDLRLVFAPHLLASGYSGREFESLLSGYGWVLIRLAEAVLEVVETDRSCCSAARVRFVVVKMPGFDVEGERPCLW